MGSDGNANWRARMVVRGGPVSHAVARAGWLVFGLVGALVMVGVAALYAAQQAPSDPEIGAGALFVGGLVVMMPIGAVLGGLVGLLAQFAARSWLTTPTEAERLTARAAQARAARAATTGLTPDGRWARSYQACAASVAAFHKIVESVPAGAGRDWFDTIGATLDDELTEALRLARLGESLDDVGGDTARTVADQLDTAEKSFAETTGRAAAIALDLHDDSDFVEVRAQLDMLAEQAPHLRAEGAS
jgi:hypothetical protein